MKSHGSIGFHRKLSSLKELSIFTSAFTLWHLGAVAIYSKSPLRAVLRFKKTTTFGNL
jgi:hypothetical protein